GYKRKGKLPAVSQTLVLLAEQRGAIWKRRGLLMAGSQGKSVMTSMGRATCERPDLLWQLLGAIHTFKRGSYVSVGQETRRKNVLVFLYLPFLKRDERARALQTSTTYHGQSSVLLAGDRCSREASCHRNAGEMGSLDT
ncbi:hypothetical protein N327_07670, partial [Fulmarus glacialis]